MKTSNNVIAWAMRNFRITFLIIGCLFVFGIYALVQFADIIKVIIGSILLRSGIWANNVVSDVD